MFGDQKEHNNDQHKPQERKTVNIKRRQWLVANEDTNIQTCPAVQRAASLHLWTTRWFVKFLFLMNIFHSCYPTYPEKNKSFVTFAFFVTFANLCESKRLTEDERYITVNENFSLGETNISKQFPLWKNSSFYHLLDHWSSVRSRPPRHGLWMRSVIGQRIHASLNRLLNWN